MSTPVELMMFGQHRKTLAQRFRNKANAIIRAAQSSKYRLHYAAGKAEGLRMAAKYIETGRYE